MIGVDGAVDLDGQGLAGELVGDGQELQGLRGRWSGRRQKSSAQTWSGCVARSRVAGTVEMPMRERFFGLGRTRSPSSRHRRWMRLWLTQKPSSASSAVMRR